jgi:hypothetical protein
LGNVDLSQIARVAIVVAVVAAVAGLVPSVAVIVAVVFAVAADIVAVNCTGVAVVVDVRSCCSCHYLTYVSCSILLPNNYRQGNILIKEDERIISSDVT